MRKQGPYIWLQEHEQSGQADCGCKLKVGAAGGALWFCSLHETATELLGALKALYNETSGKPRTSMLLLLRKRAEKAIAKADRCEARYRLRPSGGEPPAMCRAGRGSGGRRKRP